MEKTLFDAQGNAIAYITDSHHNAIYSFDGVPVAYLHEEQHVYGINGRHLGWFINEIIYNDSGERIGFTSMTCPVATAKEPVKSERRAMDELRSKWSAPPTPNLTFNFADQDLADFLNQGRVEPFVKEAPPEQASEESQD